MLKFLVIKYYEYYSRWLMKSHKITAQFKSKDKKLAMNNNTLKQRHCPSSGHTN